MNSQERAEFNRQVVRAEALDGDLLPCRVGGDRHWWQECKPDFIAQVGTAVVHQCTNCDCIKRIIVAPKYGEILSRVYEYPDGYLLTKDEEHPDDRAMSAGAVRVAMFKRPQALVEVRPLKHEGAGNG